MKKLGYYNSFLIILILLVPIAYVLHVTNNENYISGFLGMILFFIAMDGIYPLIILLCILSIFYVIEIIYKGISKTSCLYYGSAIILTIVTIICYGAVNLIVFGILKV